MLGFVTICHSLHQINLYSFLILQRHYIIVMTYFYLNYHFRHYCKHEITYLETGYRQ